HEAEAVSGRRNPSVDAGRRQEQVDVRAVTGIGRAGVVEADRELGVLPDQRGGRRDGERGGRDRRGGGAVFQGFGQQPEATETAPGAGRTLPGSPVSHGDSSAWG